MEYAMDIPVQEPNNKKTHNVYMAVELADGFIASNQTGAFPRTSNKGNKYIAVFYVHNPNFIKGIPIKSRHKEELLKAYQIVYKWRAARGYKLRIHRMDNETSKNVKEFIVSQQATIQYTAPDRHCALAEKAVQTYNSCVKSTTASLPPDFPIAYWCRLIPQIYLSVNIVRPCQQNIKLSAWAAMEGDFHFESTRIAPQGSSMLMHEKPSRRQTYAHNAKKELYLGPCLNHFFTYRGILPSTGGERMSDTVRFNHHAIGIPDLTPADRILEATRQLDDAIKQQPKIAPMDTLTAIELLREVLLGERKEKLPPNSRQLQKQKQKQTMQREPTTAPSTAPTTAPTVVVPVAPSTAPTKSSTMVPSAAPTNAPTMIPDSDAHYISDNEYTDDSPPNHNVRRRKRVI